MREKHYGVGKRKNRGLSQLLPLGYCIKVFLLLWMMSLFVFPLVAFPQESSIEVRVQASPREVYMGDPIHYEVSVEHSQEIDVLEQWPVQKIGEFEILDSTPSVKTQVGSDRSVLKKNYALIVFATGELSIPPFEVQYRDSSDEIKSIQSAPVTISVQSIIGSGTPELRDIKPPVGIPTKVGAWIYWTLAAIILVVVLFLLLVFWKRPEGELEEPPEPVIPADVWALEQLRQVRLGPALREKDAKALALATSEIVRRYLDRRFPFNTIDLTTEEIVRLLQESPIEDEIRESFGEFFSLTDLIKFAKYQPEDNVLMDIVDEAEDLVKRTRPVPVNEPSTNHPVEEGQR